MADSPNADGSGPKGAVLTLLELMGDAVLRVFSDLGGMAILLFDVVRLGVRPPYRPRNLLAACESVGFGSMFVVLLTGFFTGAVFGMQSASAFSLFGAQSLAGATVALSLTRELAPTLTGLMVTGRAGSAIATELGSMRVTEQIDALATMAVDPKQFLLVPRVLAGFLTAPILCMLFNVIGLAGAYLVSVKLTGISEAGFWVRLKEWVDLADIFGGLIKASVFGGILTTAACYKGFNAEGGAKGVGVATTEAVVLGSVLILVSDYFLTMIMLPWWQ